MTILQFFDEQLGCWPLAAENYKRLSEALLREISVDGATVKLQCNPARSVSTDAKVDKESIAARKCFLCRANRPPEQMAIPAVDGRYELLVNPYPIFTPHFVIASVNHEPQCIEGHLPDMIRLADEMPGFTVLYNGPACGASAPDHLHFQAVPSGNLPVWGNMALAGVEVPGTPVVIAADSPAFLLERAERELAGTGGEESPVNILLKREEGTYTMAVYHRAAHRPSHYFAGEDERIAVSPGAIDMAGTLVLPRLKDFERLTPEIVKDIYSEVSVKVKDEPTVDVGILTAERIKVCFNGTFTAADGTEMSGEKEFGADKVTERLTFTPVGDDATFTLSDVTIGIGFHWERREDQRFGGQLLLVPDGKGGITVINRISVEEYLLSVISSEMNAEASLEFLCAHAVISRSWLLAQIEHNAKPLPGAPVESPGEIVKWYDHDDHELFDVCADDHCQRYQGLARVTTATARQAVDMTRGLALTFEGELCDARFSKCCGGVTEEFATCWQDVKIPYLKALADTPSGLPVPDLADESTARGWIETRPDAFCARAGQEVLSTVLNGYDRETPDFYRWEVTYSAEELSAIILEKTGLDYGRIISMVPLHRGPSGRLDRLEIIGTERSRVIGKELEIRRTLSHSHLYSSAFIIEPGAAGADGLPASWTFRGAGWGHGVGLCQIGAAQMAAEGYGFREILEHYFPGASITRLYL